MDVALTLILICLTIILAKVFHSKMHSVNLPPGTMGWPIIGETMAFAKEKADFFKRKHRQYGRIYKTRLFGKPIIRVSGSENLRKLINGEYTLVESSYPTSVRKLIGEQSISMSNGEEHKQKKRVFMNSLSPEFIQNHTEVFAETITDRILTWCKKDHIDLYDECRKLFIELAARFLIDIDMAIPEISELQKQLDIFTSNIFSLPVYFPGFGFYKAYQAKLRMREIISKALKKVTNNSGERSSVSQSLKNSFFSPEIYGDNLYLDSIIELLFSGSESVSSAGFSIAHQLCRNTDVRNKLVKEIKALDGKEDISAQDLRDIPYAQSVVLETLRMLPPVGGAYRTALKTFELDGYTVPKGWTILLSIRDTHHEDPNVLNQMEFNPDRWALPDFGKDKYAFIPFGGGARMCPGQAYAKMVLTLFAVEFTRRCSPNIIRDSELIFWPTPRPANVVLINVSRVS